MTTTVHHEETQTQLPPVAFINADGTANVDDCPCGAPKLAIYDTCKACAVQQGRYSTEVEPTQVPCPICSDGRKASYALCTGCAVERHYIKADRSSNPSCPTDQCACGADKPAVFSRCNECRRRPHAIITIKNADGPSTTLLTV